MPALIQPAKSNSSNECKRERSEDQPTKLLKHKQENHIANITRPRTAKKKINIPRASCRFSLKDKNRVWREFLGLFNTGSTNSLLAKEIIDKYEMKLVEDNGVWQTNTGSFKTKYKAVARNMKLPDFSTKQEIPTSELIINPNPNQKYKAIFGLDFLAAYGIDFLNSKEKIMW